MWSALILLAQLLHRDSCVCKPMFQICQPLQLSAWVNASITLPCDFTYHQDWEPSSNVQLHWRLGHFHSTNFLFNYSSSNESTYPDFQGRVSWVKGHGQNNTASIHIKALRESDSMVYFCRVSVMTGRHNKREEWQTINGTNLTVTASSQHPEPPASPPSPSLHIGVPTGVALLAAAVTLGLVVLLLVRRKGHCQKRTRSRTAASRGRQEVEERHGDPPPRGSSAPRPEDAAAAQPPPRVPWAPGREPELVYAALLLSDAVKKAPPNVAGKAEQETTYASVRH